MQILFPGFQPLDVIGPLDVIQLVSSATLPET